MLRDQCQSLFGLGFVVARDDEIIGVAHAARAVSVEHPAHGIEGDVCQQWGDDFVLWRTHRGGFKSPVFHNPSREKFFDDVQEVPIRHFLARALQDNLVWNVIEEAGNIGVEDGFMVLAPVFQHLFHGHMTVFKSLHETTAQR